MKTTFLIGLFCCIVSLSATDYVRLTPLDTAALPEIAEKDYGGTLVRKAMQQDWIWDKNRTELVASGFSDEAMMRAMKSLYRHTHNHMVSFSCAYWSKDTHEDSLLVSGKIYLPKGRKLKGIVLSNHYTIGADYEAPSRTFCMDCSYAMKGYAVILPDYVGYGLTRTEVHPYLHWRSAAQTAVDLLNCMPAVLDFYGYEYPKEVVVTGYSQGAAVALGVVRMLDEDNSEWKVKKLYAGAGPYDPAVIFDYCLTTGETGIPGAVPMIVLGMNDAYDLDLQMEDVFTEPLLSHYNEWINAKELTMYEISRNIGSTRIEDMLHANILDKDNPLSMLLYESLQWNSNVGYDVKCPAYFLHSVTDNIVPFVTSEYLQQQMPDSSEIIFDFGEYGSHMEGALHFNKYVYQDL